MTGKTKESTYAVTNPSEAPFKLTQKGRINAKDLRAITIYVNILPYVERMTDDPSMRTSSAADGATSIICENAISYAMVVKRLRDLANEIEHDTILDGFDYEEPPQ